MSPEAKTNLPATISRQYTIRGLPSARFQPAKEIPACSQRSFTPLSPAASRQRSRGKWIDDDVGGRSHRRVRGRRRRGLRRRAPRVRPRPDGADRRRRRQMRRVPLPTAAFAGILVLERPGRQVRAEVRRAAVHRDAHHGAPLKSPEARPIGRAAPSRPCSSGDSFLPPSSFFFLRVTYRPLHAIHEKRLAARRLIRRLVANMLPNFC